MKVTIELSAEEIRGIKAYLKSTDDYEKVGKYEIAQYVGNIVSGVINSPQETVSQFIAENSDFVRFDEAMAKYNS